MDRKLLYVLSLIGFFVMWGIFGFVAARPYSEPVLRDTLAPAHSTEMNSDVADPAIPVTAQPPSARMIDLYVLLGLGIVVAILALWNVAHKPVTNYVRPKDPPKDPPDEP